MADGLIKFTSNNDFDFAVDSVTLLRDTSKDLVKRASCDKLFKNIKRDPKQEDLHIIAVGAYEGTGCFFSGAPVQTFNGIKPIEEIKLGDLVLTHNGRYRKVITTYKQEYTGGKTTLDISGLCDGIESTGNHPFYIIKAKNFNCRDRCPSLLDKTDDPIAILDDIIDQHMILAEASDIEPGDYVLTPINIAIPDSAVYSEDEAYLFGYYLSEGCLVKEYKECATKGEYKQLLFTVNNNGDQPIIDFLETFITKAGRGYSPQKSSTSEHGCRISFGHKEYATKVDRLFGHHSTKKFIHPAIFCQTRDWKLKFLAAYFDGDGCLISDNTGGLDRYIGTLTASTASRNLAYDLQRLLASCGITSSIYKGLNKKSNGCFGTQDHVIYQVNVGGSKSNAILQHCRRLKPVEKDFKYKTGRSWISSNYLVLKVKSNTSSSVENTIKYNLEVEEDNTYVVDIQGHNSNRNGDCFLEKDCKSNHHYFTKSNRAVHRHHKNKPSDPKFGNIKASAYNEPMRRIELIVGLDRDKCADILHEQETTGNSNWSMACKIQSDSCSWCGHRATSDNDRCDCVKNHLGEINKKGEMCSMINSPDPRWFEISYVKRPADRIGMSLGKVASIGSVLNPMRQSDYLNLYGDIYVPDDVLLSKKAADKRELLHKLSALEKHVDAVAHSKPTNAKDSYIKDHAHKISKTPPIDNTSMDSLRKMEPSMVLKTLADHGIIFGPEDFAKYLFDNRLPKANIEGMKSHLPHAFQDFNDDGEVTNNEKYEPDFVGKVNPELKNLTSKLHEGHSLHESPAVRRIMMITIMAGGPGKHHEPTKEAADKELAKQYISYKLAALNYLNDQGKLDDELMMNAVLQNR